MVKLIAIVSPDKSVITVKFMTIVFSHLLSFRYSDYSCNRDSGNGAAGHRAGYNGFCCYQTFYRDPEVLLTLTAKQKPSPPRRYGN